eukprot:Hpha_TRINITY_DN28274_c0_g1::TRINITY_DN28274_c0_g1_i1::g.116785::m.116785
MASGVVVVLACAGLDRGPTYGRDYAGDDYNVTQWSSPESASSNHYQASALQCETYCEADPRCCAWTYCPPGSGESEEGLGERCCLKYRVPEAGESASPHWTGVPSRAVGENGSVSAQCSMGPPYPGPWWQVPTVHNSPTCLHNGGWHDIAGAFTLGTEHHVFQGCPGDGGWHHASSTDLVTWTNHGVQVKKRHETYAGMDSDDSPCSGFVVQDDESGAVCAGFRQCGSSKGVAGGHAWDVPLELRCATNSSLEEWGEAEYIFNVSYYRALPYDPVRPWKDSDGAWYATIATDACNETTRKVPCAGGGQLELYTSPHLRGSGAAWRRVGPMFRSNRTALTGHGDTNIEGRELVTADYIGGLPGDPRGGATRLVFNNDASATGSGTTMYFIGTQKAGGHFVD